MRTDEEYEQLKAERDKLKEEIDRYQTMNEHKNVKIYELKADNERLKEKLEMNVENWMEFKVTSEIKRLQDDNERLKEREKLFNELAENWFKKELQRRWPSEEDLEFFRRSAFLETDDIDRMVTWLKSYLENK